MLFQGFNVKKNILFFLLLQPFILTQSQEVLFQSGNFICIEGNNDSICPQRVKAIYEGDRLVEFRVMYNGDCAGQGPYSFSCYQDECGGTSQHFQLLDSNHYQWQNRQHGVLNECLFERELREQA